MTKIKNFRIALRSREIVRWLKTHEHLQITPALEASVEHAISDSKRFVQSAAVYTTLTRAIAQKTTALPISEPAVALSVIAVTIGPALEEERREAWVRNDAMQASLLGAVQEEALHQAVQFSVRLIQEQAKEEDCDMSAPQPIQDASLLPSLAALLGVQRIGIAFDAAAPQFPSYARLVWTLWTPVAKSASRRSDASQRSVAAAV